jgi:hypothetical protein
VDDGYGVTVVSEAALGRWRVQLGRRGDAVRWVVADVTNAPPHLGSFDVWHDRAAFHFFTDLADRPAYVALLARSVRAGDHVVIATFAPDGPEQCSGLPVRHCDGPALAAELGPGFSQPQ